MSFDNDLLLRVKRAVEAWQGEAISDMEAEGLIDALHEEGVELSSDDEEED